MDKDNKFPHLIVFIKSRTEGTERRNKKYMKKIVLIVLSIVTLCGCKSDFEKMVSEASKEAEEYADALNNAKSEEEVRILKQQSRDRGKYYDEEFEKMKNDISFKEMQKVMHDENYKRLSEKVKTAERNARNRFK